MVFVLPKVLSIPNPQRVNNKKASRDLFPFRSRGWLDKSFLYWFLGLQHFTPNLRLPASPIGKEAVGKSEVIKSVGAWHHVSCRFRRQSSKRVVTIGTRSKSCQDKIG
jgi:hypothetical protein